MRVKNIVSTLLIPAVMLCSVSLSFAYTDGGSGTETDPYLIGSVADWNEFRRYVMDDPDGGAGEYWKLTADIDFADAEGNKGWIAGIGEYDTNNQSSGILFKGNLDGDGHAVKNYTVNATQTNLGDHGAFGLFAAVGGNAVIENLGVENAELRIGAGYIYITAGGIVGRLTDNAVISNCYSKDVTCNQAWGDGHFSSNGGIAGSMNGTSTIKTCYSLGFEESNDKDLWYHGGIVGAIYSSNTKIQKCYSDTTIGAVSVDKWGSGWYELYYPNTTVLEWPNGFHWDGGSYIGYIGDDISIDEIKAVPDNIKSDFIADTSNVNNGYPILRPITAGMTQTEGESDGRVGFYIEDMYLPAYSSVVVDYSAGTGYYPLSRLIDAGQVNSNVSFGLQINDVPEEYRNDISVSLSKREVPTE